MIIDQDWNDIALTLETATPTFGQGIPYLDIWSLSVYQPLTKLMRHGRMMSSVMPAMSVARSGLHRYAGSSETPRPIDTPMELRSLFVSSKGNVSATFNVPGKITIPSDNVAHNVTIAQLQLDAVMSWVSVPKKDAKTHLSVCIVSFFLFTLLNPMLALIRAKSRMLLNILYSVAMPASMWMEASSLALMFQA